jgi:enoyl-CoA hydratase/carnithine racemase
VVLRSRARVHSNGDPRTGPAARIILNRPRRRNALSLDLMGKLIRRLSDLGRDSSLRAIVLEGAGPVFSAGHDLAEMVGRDEGFYERLFGRCAELMEAVYDVPQPVIAKVHGTAYAAGCQLVAACDLVVAAEETRFATPGVKIGLPCSTPMVPLSRAVGRKRALELLLTAESIDASTALEWGLVSRVVPADDLERAVIEPVEQIAASSPHAVAVGKQLFYEQVDCDEHDAYEVSVRAMAEHALAADAQEGIGAFLEKREPTWRGE